MPAHEKVSVQEIVNSLLRWRGNLQAAASELGLNRGALYERIQRVGIDLAGFRAATKHVTPITGVSGMSGFDAGVVVARGASVGVARKSSTPSFPGASEKRRLGAMQEPMAVEEVPIKTAPARRLAPLRLRPDLREGLQRAAWRLQARYQVQTDESLILEQLVEETLEAWLASKLGAAEAKPKRKKSEEA